MIARTVHGCNPIEQLQKPIFSRFSSSSSSKKDKDKDNQKTIYISIDNIPKLYNAC
jgi:hypothetical protein